MLLEVAIAAQVLCARTKGLLASEQSCAKLAGILPGAIGGEVLAAGKTACAILVGLHRVGRLYGEIACAGSGITGLAQAGSKGCSAGSVVILGTKHTLIGHAADVLVVGILGLAKTKSVTIGSSLADILISLELIIAVGCKLRAKGTILSLTVGACG